MVAGTSILKAAGAVTALGGVVAMSFVAWFTIMDAIAEEAGKQQRTFYASQVQRDVDEVNFAIYQVVHKLEEIEARADNDRAWKTDTLQHKQLVRQLDILLQRQAIVLDALEKAVQK